MDINMRETKIASPCVQSARFCHHLGKHFLEVADEARVNGNEELAIHFIDLALEIFEEDFRQHNHVVPVITASDSDVLSSFAEV